MASIKRLGWLAAAAVILPLGVAAPALAGDFLNLTISSDTTFNVDLSIGQYSVSETDTTAVNFWDVGGEFGPFPLYTPHTQGGHEELYSIAWIVPGGSAGNLAGDLFDVLLIGPSGNYGTTNLVVYRDVGYSDFLSLSFNQCTVEFNAVPCPIVANGTTVGVPFELYEATTADLFGTLETTLNDDRFGGAVPEPAAWALMIAGFSLTGAALRRRRGPILN